MRDRSSCRLPCGSRAWHGSGGLQGRRSGSWPHGGWIHGGGESWCLKNVRNALLLTSGVLHDELVKSEGFASGSGDASARGFGETESGDGHLGAVEDALVVGDGADNDSSAVSSLAEVLHQLGDGHRGAGGPAGDESAEDGLGEGGVSSTVEESEELDQQVVVEVLRPGVNLVLVLESALVDQIDTLNAQ